MFPWQTIILLTCYFFCAAPSAAQSIHLVQDPWPPITSENITEEGLATEIVMTALQIAGYEPDVATIPWKRALVEVENLTSDAIVAAYYNEERSKLYNYSAPYLITPVLFMKRRDKDISFNTLEDLKNFNIGYVRATSAGNTFDTADYLNKIELGEPTSVIRMLYFNRIDIAPFTSVVGAHLINSQFPDWKDELEYFGSPLARLHYYLIIGKDHPKGEQILTDFNNAIAQMNDSGQIQKIIKRHGLLKAFPDSITTQ